LDSTRPFSIRLESGRTVSLVIGARLSARDLGGAGRAAVAEVTAHPHDTAAAQLKNLGAKAWTVTNSLGIRARVEPGNSITLQNGIRIDFGDFAGAIERSAGAPAQQATSSPPPKRTANPASPARSSAASAPTPASQAKTNAGASQGHPTAAAASDGLSIWWLIVPTLVYAYLTRNALYTLLLAAIAVGLKVAQARPEVPEKARKFVPLLQIPMVFIFLGGSIVAIAVAAAAAVAAFKFRDQIIEALEPWWQIQAQMSVPVRRLTAIGLSLVIGYGFGINSSGNEWTYTFISIVIATVLTFLLLFTPPARQPSSQEPR
jgi:hypothetical protein